MLTLGQETSRGIFLSFFHAYTHRWGRSMPQALNRILKVFFGRSRMMFEFVSRMLSKTASRSVTGSFYLSYARFNEALANPVLPQGLESNPVYIAPRSGTQHVPPSHFTASIRGTHTECPPAVVIVLYIIQAIGVHCVSA